jgi:PAS domain S-box-containing protein
MGALSSMNPWLAGFFAFAAVHYTFKWWFSRSERVLLVFAIQCALYTVFCSVSAALARATTIPEVQAGLVRAMSLGPLLHVVLLQFYASVSDRRDRPFRALLTLTFIGLGALNLWVPLRGTVVALQAVPWPGGGVHLAPIRTPPGAPLALYYFASAVAEGYGLFVALALWRRDRSGAVLVAVAAFAIVSGTAISTLVDFAGLPMPYLGALPHTLFVLSMALLLSREYSARGARVSATARQFEAVFERSPIGKALLGPDGRFLRVNVAFSRILGSSAEEICARRLYDFFPDDDEGKIETESGRLLGAEGGAFTVEKRLCRKDGDPAWVLLVVSVIPGGRGQPVQMIAQIQDVTELRAYRERLEQVVATRTHELREAKDEAERASQAKSRFLAHMSHEIRSPLHAMLLNALILESDPALGAEQQKRTETIRRSGKHLTEIINGVLEMSKVEAGRLALVEDQFDIRATLDDLAQMFAADAAANGTALTIDPTSVLPPSLLGDGGKVKQILINLLSNAVKFTRQGSVRIRATWSAGAERAALVEIVVDDTGIGIAEQDRARIFQPFDQLDGGARAGGTGLGLAISLAYARLMGGDLTVESAPGAGSRFKLTFAAKRAASEQARQPSGPYNTVGSLVSARWKVLIVDDMDVNRDAVAAVLARHGFDTRTAADGSTGLSLHADWGPHVVLMDLRMPGMNGLEAIRRLRAAGSNAAIGALTAGAFGDDERQALRAGADFFLRKPFNDRELLDALTRILDARGTPEPQRVGAFVAPPAGGAAAGWSSMVTLPSSRS